MERQDEVRRKELIKVIKRKSWKVSTSSKISENHFPAEKLIQDKNHPDYIPNVFVFTRRRNTTQIYKKKKSKNLQKKVVNEDTQSDRQAAAFALMLLSCTPGEADEKKEDTEVSDTEQDDDLIKSYEIKKLKKEKFRLQKQVDMLELADSILLYKKQIWLEFVLKKLNKVFCALRTYRRGKSKDSKKKKKSSDARRRKLAAIPIVTKQFRPRIRYNSNYASFWRYVYGLGMISPDYVKNGIRNEQESLLSRISSMVQKARVKKAADMIATEVTSAYSSYSLRSATVIS